MMAMAVACAAGLTLAACDGDGDSGGDDTPAADGTPREVEGGAERLQEAGRRYGDATFTVVYALRGPDGEGAGEELTLYKDGRERRRVDITSEQEGEAASLTFIQTADAAYLCFEDPQDAAPELGVAGEGICLRSDPESDATLLADLFEEIERLSETSRVVGITGRQIAGRQAECFTIEDRATAAESTACFDEAGILLYTEDDAGEIREATHVSTTVDDGDFELPYEVTDAE